jgi:DNA-binding Xre family transcriptional regulator
MSNKPTKFGRQPAALKLFKAEYKISEVASLVEINHRHIRHVIIGRVRPRPELVDALCGLLECEPEDLFTAEVLAKPYRVTRPAKR